jgi:enoyl-CoA hydratase/carnithine racemase
VVLKMISSFLQLEEGKRVWVTFTRESHLNAMNNEGTVLLNRVALAIREDPDIRVVVIRGRGRAFCTGIDLKQLSSDEIDMSYHERWEKALRIFEQMEKNCDRRNAWILPWRRFAACVGL